MSDIRKTVSAVRAARQALKKLIKDLPDLDAYSSVLSIAENGEEYLNKVLRDLPGYMKEANARAKKHPDFPGKKRF